MGALHCAGFRVRFLVRQESLSAETELLSRGLTALCSTDASFRQSISRDEVPQVFTENSECLRSCRCVLVATKRTANAAVKAQLTNAGVCCPVVFLQNGLRVREELGAVEFEVVESVVSFNVVRDRVASTVTMSQTMDTAVLVLDGKCPASKSIAASLVRTPITTKVDEDFRAVQCGKLLINMTNAVNALSGVGIGPMLMERDYRLVVAASIVEAQEVFKADGVTPKAPSRKDAFMLRWFVTLLRSPQIVFSLAVGWQLRGRGEGRTSMSQDLLERKAETEVLFLNGEVVRLGHARGIPTPVNTKLVQMVQEAEAARNGCPMLSGRELVEACRVGQYKSSL